MTESSSPIVWATSYGRDLVPAHAVDGDVVVVPADAGPHAFDRARVLVHPDPDDAWLDLPHLERVIVPFVGIRPSLRERLLARPHVAVSNSHVNASAVAQHAVAMALALVHRIVPFDQAMRAGRWRVPGPSASSTLTGSTALLVGFGAIGKAAVPILRGLGLQIVAVRRHPDPNATDPREIGPADLAPSAAHAAVTIVSLPGTDATRSLLGAAFFAALPSGAVVVNVGRGDVIDEEAAWDALESGRLAGLGIDVWWRYPTDRDAAAGEFGSTRPFHERSDVLLSPHRASEAVGMAERTVADVLATARAHLAGVPRPSTNVDPSAGY